MVIEAARPDVINHNLETVPRLYPHSSGRALTMQRSLRSAEDELRTWLPAMVTKSGIMVGDRGTSGRDTAA